MAYGAKRADEIYTVGPETITARATQIVAGLVSVYSKRVLSTSEPSGPRRFRSSGSSPVASVTQRSLKDRKLERSVLLGRSSQYWFRTPVIGNCGS